ncbi:hypothetical protein [Rhizobium sp. Root482]|jgi:hypothetical protein|nr:hypothetical protein [Rhizobium sp. Root482]
MTIISMITLSALVLVCLSHLAAIRAQRQERKQKSLVPVPIRITDRH